MSQELDLSEYTQAKSAAKATCDRLKEWADEIGQSPNTEVHMREERDGYVVYWEGGPYDWAIRLTGGETMMFSSSITGFMETDGYVVEPEYSFALCFTNL